jgi:predicted amidohydrolase
MRIALACAPVKNKNLLFNLNQMKKAVEDCRGKAELILFGESVLQGFDSLCWNYKTDCEVAVSLTDEPIRQMCSVARENQIAISFGFIQKTEDALYSSQILIGAEGEVVNLFHRVSVGWKEYTKSDEHYREGCCFESFSYLGKRFAVGLCGDLWTDGRPEEMNALHADVVLWPVWCDYAPDEWNKTIKYEYAQQAARCAENVLLVNPFCADPNEEGLAMGGAAYFRNGAIISEIPSGMSGILIAELIEPEKYDN